MVRYAVIYRCIAGGALLFHKYFCCWIIDRILSTGSVRFHSLSMEWKIWCKLRLTLKLFRSLVFFLFKFNCQAISQHLFLSTIRGISYSWFSYGGTFERDVVLQLPVKLEVENWCLWPLFGESAGSLSGFKWFGCLVKTLHHLSRVNLPTRSTSFPVDCLSSAISVAAEVSTAFDWFPPSPPPWNVSFTFCSGLSILERMCLGRRSAISSRRRDSWNRNADCFSWAADWAEHNNTTARQKDIWGLASSLVPWSPSNARSRFVCVCLRYRSHPSSLFLFPTDAALRLRSCVRTGDKTCLPPWCASLF